MIGWTGVTLVCLIVSLDAFSLNARTDVAPSRTAVSTPLPSQQLNAVDREIISSILEIAFDISASKWEQRFGGNVVQSPVSIASLLNILLLGSRGPSHAQLKGALHYPENITDLDIHQSFSKILDSLRVSGSGVEVSTSSRIFIEKNLPIIDYFKTLATNSYQTKLVELSFAKDPAVAVNSINDWVKRETRGKITNLISRPFPPSTKLVAANVIYFNGAWETPFMDRLTANGIFYTGQNNKNISIPMMQNIMNVPFLKGDLIGFDMIALPYKGGKYSMYILTPNSYNGIPSLQRMEHILNSYILDDFISRMTMQRVFVKMPRMKLSNKIYLKNDLKNLGVEQIFDSRFANFGRLTTQTGIFVDDIIHEATIEITEVGTAATAATSATFDRIGGHEIFHLDRPSLLLIRDNVNNLTLFWARVIEPEPIFI